MAEKEGTEELTPEQIWNQEVVLREGPTDDKSAAPDKPAPEAEEPVIDNATTQTGDDDAKSEPDTNAQILEQLKKLEQRQRNVEGHIGGLKTAQQQLHAAMEEARKATPASDNAPSKSEVAAASANPEKWEELKKDFPEWAEATEALLGSRLQGIKTDGLSKEDFDRALNERLEQVTASMRQQVIDDTLDAILPGWKKEVQGDQFKAWFEAQTDEVKALAESTSVGDAARMLRLYDAGRQEDPSEKLKNERKQRLAQGTPLPNGTPAQKSKTLDQMTDEEIWNLEAKRREQQRAQRGY